MSLFRAYSRCPSVLLPGARRLRRKNYGSPMTFDTKDRVLGVPRTGARRPDSTIVGDRRRGSVRPTADTVHCVINLSRTNTTTSENGIISRRKQFGRLNAIINYRIVRLVAKRWNRIGRRRICHGCASRVGRARVKAQVTERRRRHLCVAQV